MSARPVFDGTRFAAALDTIRRYRRISWRELAREADVHPSLLTRLAQGKHPDIDNLLRLLDWSGLALTDYIDPDWRSPSTTSSTSGPSGRDAG